MHLLIRRLNEPKLIHAGIGCQRGNQPDIRTLRRLNRADAAVVGGVHVPHFKPRTLTRKPPGTKRGQPPLVRDFGQRIRLVHELGKLAAAEELLDCRDHRLGVDQVMRKNRLHVEKVHPFPDAALHSHEAEAELVLQKFTD